MTERFLRFKGLAEGWQWTESILVENHGNKCFIFISINTTFQIFFANYSHIKVEPNQRTMSRSKRNVHQPSSSNRMEPHILKLAYAESLLLLFESLLILFFWSSLCKSGAIPTFYHGLYVSLTFFDAPDSNANERRSRRITSMKNFKYISNNIFLINYILSNIFLVKSDYHTLSFIFKIRKKQYSPVPFKKANEYYGNSILFSLLKT